MFSLITKMPILLAYIFAFFISSYGAMAQTIPTPDDGKTWTLHFHDDSYDRNINGVVTYSKGQYQIEIKSIEFNGETIPSTIPTIVQSQEVTNHKSLSFVEPKYETRFSHSAASIMADASQEADAFVSFPDQAPDLDHYIIDPDLKLGTFLDGKKLTEAEAEAYSNELRDKMSSDPFGSFTNRIFYPMFMKKSEAQEYQKVMSFQSALVVGIVNANIPLDFHKTVGSGVNIQTIVETKDVNANIEISRILISSGVEMRLYRPQSNDGWKTITWDWYIRADGNGQFEAKGSRELGNPIIWGPAPEITDVLVLNDQEHIIQNSVHSANENNGAIYPWLDPQAQARFNESVHSFERELVIIGKNLKGLVGKTPKSSLSSLSYSPIAEMDEETVFKRMQDIHQTEAINQESLIVYSAYKHDKELDILSTTVKIRSSTNAQMAKFAVNDSEVEWPLLFGSHIGQIRVVRVDVPAAENYSNSLKKRPDDKSKTREEIANPLFFRDEILFEVEFDHKPAELPVRISLENAGAEDGVEAYREKTIELEPFGGDGKVFRSRRFILVNSETYGKEKMADGSNSVDNFSDVAERKILAWKGDELLKARLISTQTGQPLPDTLVLDGKTFVEGNFLAALEKAASCYPDAPKIDWDTVSADDELDFARKKATTLTPGFFLTSKSVDISYGQHAAMLMLREAYYPYIQQSLDLAKSYIDPKNPISDKLERAMLAMWQNKATPISHFPGRTGGNLHDVVQHFANKPYPRFYRLYGGRKLIDFGLVRSVAPAIRDIIRNIEASIKTARNTNICDVDGLLLITGTGFVNIVEDLQTKVVRYETDPIDKIKKIRPDMAGRRSLEDIYIYRDIYDKYGKLSDAWVSIYKLVGALVTVGAAELGALGAEAALSANFAASAGIAVSAADLGYTLVDNYKGYQEDERRLNFARGASVAFGREYLKRETDKTTNPLWRIVDVAGSGIGAANDVTQILGGGNLIAKGVQNARSIAKNGSSFRSQADEILDAANSSLSKYGNVAKKSEVKNFKQIAAKVGEKLTKNPSKTLSELTDTELTAVRELLGTPAKFLTSKYKNAQKVIRQTLELPNAGAVESLVGALPTAPDIVDTVSDYVNNEDALNLIPEIELPAGLGN